MELVLNLVLLTTSALLALTLLAVILLHVPEIVKGTKDAIGATACLMVLALASIICRK